MIKLISFEVKGLKRYLNKKICFKALIKYHKQYEPHISLIE